MAYFLVMGGLALAVCFTLGWGLWRIGRWAFGRLARRRPSGGRRPARTRQRRDAAKGRASSTPSSPWRLTQALSRLRGAWPLALVAWLLYGGTRLAAHGMAARPRQAPGAFLHLVDILGWGAIGLLAMAILGLLATWRCRSC
ncbi:hypothetical protein [Halomonas organivorans]|uniref:Uncharacterized protein n=1 Tax=Halomonas organivorans TaxID=257772 RepID=A0A7W5BXI7_9GAMM|nr:hypothetical protein [Halomonas organivorans]MBB3140664.1 hypothetical protein [Halomonas organivorans]